MRELRTGLWYWQAPHPDWTATEQWPQLVSSYAIDDGTRLLLLDALSVPDDRLERPVKVVLPTHGVPNDRTALERALA